MDRIKWLTLFVLFLVLIGLCVIPMLSRWYFNQQLSFLSESELTDEYVFVANHDKLHIGNSVHDMFEITKSVSDDGFFKEVLVVDSGRIWFVYIEYQQVGQKWCLASIDLEGQDFKVHYSDTFMTSPNSKRSEVCNECQRSYFENKSWYYNDGKIVLTDYAKLIEYDLLCEAVQEFNSSQYIHPTCPYDSEISNSNLISISTQNDYRSLSFAEAARISEEFNSLMELNNHKTWDGTSVLVNLFDSVIYDGSDLYLVCRVLNYAGETHLAVFRYLFDSNELYYCFNHFNNDVINNGFYIVPKSNN